jgi:N-[(2S)-2-amino-2-carboxyethyl]-L-glutamate dehydrogenase
MHSSDILIVKGNEIASLLKGRELELIQIVSKAYQTHSLGSSVLPHSTFLRFPYDQRNRIIALPAYLGGEFEIAGIKWVSSFPNNTDVGLDRASAVVILNSMATGRPEAIMEGSIISAKRTAASAALAAQSLCKRDDSSSIALIGCGLINFEIAQFLQAAMPSIRKLFVFDAEPQRAIEFSRKCAALDGVDVQVVENLGTLLGLSPLISMATTAVTPHILDLSRCQPGSTILHISLRDLAPELIPACDNVVDDIDHVCRAQTSIHLAEQLTGGRDFIRTTLGDVLLKRASARKDDDSILVFSPFGLGVLDIAVAKLVVSLKREEGTATLLSSFFPDSWR